MAGGLPERRHGREVGARAGAPVVTPDAPRERAAAPASPATGAAGRAVGPPVAVRVGPDPEPPGDPRRPRPRAGARGARVARERPRAQGARARAGLHALAPRPRHDRAARQRRRSPWRSWGCRRTCASSKASCGTSTLSLKGPGSEVERVASELKRPDSRATLRIDTFTGDHGELQPVVDAHRLGYPVAGADAVVTIITPPIRVEWYRVESRDVAVEAPEILPFRGRSDLAAVPGLSHRRSRDGPGHRAEVGRRRADGRVAGPPRPDRRVALARVRPRPDGAVRLEERLRAVARVRRDRAAASC